MISIIIATFNAETTLERCLKSIFPQLNDSCELIIIDGGSKDQTVDIIESYKKYLAYTISESDRGIYDAWNKGIEHAKGDWIMFVGADDELLPYCIYNYSQFISSHDVSKVDYICSRNEYVDKNGKVIKLFGEEPKWKIFRKYMKIAHVGSLHSKKNLFDEIGLFNFKKYRICADYDLLLRKRECLNYLFMPKITARMQIGGMSFSLNALLETYKIHKHILGNLENIKCFLRGYFSYILVILINRIKGNKI